MLWTWQWTTFQRMLRVRVDIHATSRVAMTEVLLELFNSLMVSEVRINGNATTFTHNATALLIDASLAADEAFIVSVDYAGTPPNGASNPLGGGGMTNATSPTWGAQVTWSLSEPFSAMEWFPCKQSLRDKADSCSVKITVPDNLKAGANGTLEATINLGNGTTRYEWMHRHVIDYYLISVAIAEYVEHNFLRLSSSW